MPDVVCESECVEVAKRVYPCVGRATRFPRQRLVIIIGCYPILARGATFHIWTSLCALAHPVRRNIRATFVEVIKPYGVLALKHLVW